MAKTSKQRLARQKKDQSGCMWGLISMFDFRHGRATRRLLSDRRRYTANNTHGSPYLTPEANSPTNSEEIHPRPSIEKPGFDLVRTRVKELIEEEMFVDQDPKKETDTSKIESFELEHSNRVANHKHKHTKNTLKESFDHEITMSHQVSSQKTAQYHDLEALVKEILLIYQKKNAHNGDLDTGAKRSFPIVEEKLVAAIEALLNEKSRNGDHKKFHHSRELFQMLSSNKEMFFKLLQDQNLILLKEDQKSKSKSTSKSMVTSNLPETEKTDQEPEESVTRKHRKFFRRRSKSVDNISLNEKDKIVILKPGSPQNELGHEHPSQFSFMEIKRRLKNAMGKEQRTPGKPGVDGGWSSPNRDHFYTERFAKVTNFRSWRSKDDLTPDRVSKLREPETKNDDRISNIYVEAKKHLSEMLTSGDEDAELMMRSLPRSLGRILSLREYNSLSPGTSPKAQTRATSRDDIHMVNKSQPSTNTENVTFEGALVSKDSDMVNESQTARFDIEHEEQTESVDALCDSNGVDDDHIAVIPHDSNEESSSDNLKADLPNETEISSCETHIERSVATKTEKLEVTPSDKAGKPSPISVLDQLFSDDDISPARTVSRPVEAAVQPLRIQFEETVSRDEDQQIRITDSADSEESAFEYTEAVLLSSDLNWTDFEKRWLSGVQILDPSLFEEVETFSGRARYDQRLLFDSTNEVLEEVCDHFIPESLFIKRNVWPVPKGMDLINEVWRRLESRLCKIYPRDINKLVRNDLETSKVWLDLDIRCENREIVIKIQESIFEETMDDTLLSLLDERKNNGVFCS